MNYSSEYVADLRREKNDLLDETIELKAEVAELRRLLDEQDALSEECCNEVVLKYETRLDLIAAIAKGE